MFAYCFNNWVNMFDPSGCVGKYVFAGGYDLITGLPVLMETAPDSETISINIPSEYRYKQTSYKKFEMTLKNGQIKNVGCSATSLATCLSYIKGIAVSPESIPWLNGITEWDSLAIQEKNFPASLTYIWLYYELQKGKPVMFYVRTSSGSGHYVTVTGVKGGKSIADLTMNDFTILDSYDAKTRSLGYYSESVDFRHMITFK